MATVQKKKGPQETLGDAVRHQQSRLFVGRRQECKLFVHHLVDHAGSERILNVFGSGGMGKSYLLDKFRRLAEEAGALYLSLDSRDIPRPPDTLAKELLAAFHAAEPNRCLVLALDTYEEMGDLDRWVRDHLLPRLPSRALVVIAGRHPLQGAWRASPAWRQVIKPVPLGDFDLSLTREYLDRCDIHEEALIQQLWAFTRGHPLALSLAATLPCEVLPPSWSPQQEAEAVRELTDCWLREVPDERLRALVEAAAAVRRFNQEILSHLVAETVSAADFDRLTSLSFVRLERDTWALHDLVRTVVTRELRWRAPTRFRTLWHRGVSWYREKIFASAVEPERSTALAEFFYLLGDVMVRATFFSVPPDSGLYVEPAGPGDLAGVEKYFVDWVADVDRMEQDVSVDFLDQDTDTRYAHVVSVRHLRKEPEMIRPAELLRLESDAVRLCRNPSGEILGLSIVIPVSRRTLAYLCEQPVTGPYFRRLTPAERAEYASPEKAPAAWFIRLLDSRSPTDSAARAVVFRGLFPLLLRGGRLLASTPLPFYQGLLCRFGFEEVPGATHFDYGPDVPSPTYLLDLRGPRLAAYIDRLAERVGASVSPVLPTNVFGLTKRERDVAQMVLAGLSNADIARRLVISQVTVKKHLSHMFAKTEVSSRTQLIRKLLTGGVS